MKHSIFYFGILFMMVLFSCTRKNPATLVHISPPFQNVRVPSGYYDIDASKGGEIRVESGTRIFIPALAFTDQNGNPVTGKVKIAYREFHSSAQIITSGIPMNYDSAGHKMNFESAGMFEISGSANGANVKLAKGKNIEVQMASYKEGNRFNFYRYDSTLNNWIPAGTASAVPNSEKVDKLNSLDTIKNEKPADGINDRNLVSLDLDIYNVYPELRPFQNILWQYKGENFTGFMNVIAGKYLTNLQIRAEDKKKMIYMLEADSGSHHYAFKVHPILDDIATRRQFEKDMKRYQQVKAQMIKDRARLEKLANLLRVFKISNFGIFNWDCAMKDPLVVQAPADFDFDQPVDKTKTTVYLVCGDERKIVTYYPGCWGNFSFNPNTRNCLIAVMPADRLAIFDANDFRSINNWKIGNPIHFTLKTRKQQIKSVAQLDEVLKRI
jgi:hypothetical protein